MTFCLSSLVVKFLFELLNLVCNLLLTSQNFLKFGLFPDEIPSTVFNFIAHLLRVLEMHLFNLPVHCLNVVAQLVTHGFLAHECLSNIEKLLEQITILGTEFAFFAAWLGRIFRFLML